MLIEMALVHALLDDPHNAEADIQQGCLIENAIYESIGEGPRGMQLVTEIVINRLDVNYRGAETHCEVIHSPAQFSWTRIPEDKRLTYTEEEYYLAAQVVLSVLYDDIPRILPEEVLHYLNPRTATDLSWYAVEDIALTYRNHHFLQLD